MPSEGEPDPAVQPFRHAGGRVGVLMCHGFTGSPASLRPWAEHLAERGYSVELPRLPGHGTVWQDLNRTAWPDWYRCVERSLLDLAERCDAVVVAGLSMGGCLALRLAQEHGPLVQGLVLVNPAVASGDPRLRALPLLRLVKPSVAAIGNDIARPGQDEHAYDRTPLPALYSQTRLWRLVLRDLAAITQPLLLYRSTNDHVVDATGAPQILAGVSSTDVTETELHHSYHVATLDHDASAIFDGATAFIERITEGSRVRAHES
ncbi:carboxylesterase [Haloactinopolyspora alba]|uniref:Carboxylesterase n=1 Tax=Haloactinopolyspora alba TaxID=648780 RepID=A0A2P8DEF3_9ACTN|nr:alpha/beta fold hydrolase [Haloactinopolyspora alba]PSK95569.1 carboxylesterase [Haloactinopolyspora alba]